jgi:hypothetical protein
MAIPQNPVIVGLGILLSFILFAQGEKYNQESTELGVLLLNCKSSKADYENCIVRRNPEISKQYGVPYWELETRKARQMVFLIIPSVVLIITLFVSFSASSNEKYLTLIALTPLFLSFLRFYPYAPEKWMIPVYLLFAATVAFLISHFKRFLFMRTP